MDPIVLAEAQKAHIKFITQLEDDSAFPLTRHRALSLTSFITFIHNNVVVVF